MALTPSHSHTSIFEGFLVDVVELESVAGSMDASVSSAHVVAIDAGALGTPGAGSTDSQHAPGGARSPGADGGNSTGSPCGSRPGSRLAHSSGDDASLASALATLAVASSHACSPRVRRGGPTSAAPLAAPTPKPTTRRPGLDTASLRHFLLRSARACLAVIGRVFTLSGAAMKRLSAAMSRYLQRLDRSALRRFALPLASVGGVTIGLVLFNLNLLEENRTLRGEVRACHSGMNRGRSMGQAMVRATQLQVERLAEAVALLQDGSLRTVHSRSVTVV